jgi:hypothetical protein
MKLWIMAIVGIGLSGLMVGCGDSGDEKTVVAAYQGCVATDDTKICGDGSSCQLSGVTSTNPAEWCSKACTTAQDCPSEVGGRTKGCFQPMGATAKQCYATCPSASSTCPTGTVCNGLMSQEGTALRLCVPQGT